MSILVLFAFLNYVGCLLVTEFQDFLLCFRYKPIIGYEVCKYFLSVCGLPFQFLMMVLKCKSFKFHFIFFFKFVNNTFSLIAKKSLHYSSYQKFYLSSKIFVVLTLTFTSMIHFELLFCVLCGRV